MAQINREGTVNFGDASLSIWEEPGGPVMISGEWGRTFRRQVFARIIQQLKRLGWTVGSWKDAAHYIREAAGVSCPLIRATYL